MWQQARISFLALKLWWQCGAGRYYVVELGVMFIISFTFILASYVACKHFVNIQFHVKLCTYIYAINSELAVLIGKVLVCITHQLSLHLFPYDVIGLLRKKILLIPIM